MKPEVVESEKNLLVLKFEELDQAVLNLVRDELWQSKATTLAGFRITHPQIGEAIFTLKTKGSSAKSVWNEANSRINKQLDDLDKQIAKL